MGRSQICVGESPPSFGLPEDQIDPSRRLVSFQKSEQASGNKQGPHVSQRLAKIPGRVQNIGSDDQVELLRGKSLNLRGVFDIQQSKTQERKLAELLAGALEE